MPVDVKHKLHGKFHAARSATNFEHCGSVGPLNNNVPCCSAIIFHVITYQANFNRGAFIIVTSGYDDLVLAAIPLLMLVCDVYISARCECAKKKKASRHGRRVSIRESASVPTPPEQSNHNQTLCLPYDT